MTTFRDEGFQMVGESVNSGYAGAGSFVNTIALTGSNQATGTQLTANLNVIASGSVCVLPLGVEAGAVVEIINPTAGTVVPYPPVGFSISNQTTNVAGTTIAAISTATSGVGRFVSDGKGNFFNC